MIAAAGGLLALAALYTELPVWAIMVVLFIRSTGTAFHSPAFSATTPMIVPKDELTKCAGYAQTIQAVSSIISPAAAAFLYAVWPLNAIIMLDIVGAILACVTVAISAIPTPDVCTEQKSQQFMQDIKEGYMVLKRNRGLFALLWIGVIYMFSICRLVHFIHLSVCPILEEHQPMLLPQKLLLLLVCCWAVSS